MRSRTTAAVVAVLVAAAGVTAAAVPASAAGCTVTVTGTVKDAVTGAPVEASIQLLDADGSEFFDNSGWGGTSPDGSYTASAPCRDGDGVVLARTFPSEPYGFGQYAPHATDIAHARTFSLREARTFEEDVLMEPGGLFVPVDPTRVIDTRTDGHGPLGPRERRSFTLDEVPADATAVVLNLTATQGTAPTSFVSVIGDDDPAGTPTTSVINPEYARDVANLVTVAVAPPVLTGRDVPQVTLYNNAGTTHLVADLAGYYVPTEGAGFVGIAPERVLDTRTTTPLGAGETRRVPVSSVWQAPEDAVAAIVTVTTTHATAGTSYVSAFPTGAPDGPSTSVVNAYRGSDIANLAIVRLGPDGDIDVYNDRGETQVIVDVVGWFVPGGQSRYHALDPKRAEKIVTEGQQTHYFMVDEFLISTYADGVMLNVTTFGATRPSYLQMWKSGSPQPYTSVTNARPGAHVGAAVLTSGWIVKSFNSGDTSAFVDVAGFFAEQ